MARIVHRDEVRELLGRGAVAVEVLGEKEYLRLHIAGAVHLPLDGLDRRRAGTLDRGRSLVVYCYDSR